MNHTHFAVQQGNARYMKGDFIGAADAYAQAINIHGPRPVLMSNLAATYLKLELYVPPVGI